MPNVYKPQIPYQNQWQVSGGPTQGQYSLPTKASQQSYSRPSTQQAPAVPSANRPQYTPPTSYTPPKPMAAATVSKNDPSQSYNSYYQQAEQRYSQQKTTERSFPSLAPIPPLSRNTAPVANMLGSGSPLTASSLGQRSAIPTMKEYVEHLQHYPYLKNAYARRPATYNSPYAVGGGFNQEYEIKLQAALDPSLSMTPKQEVKQESKSTYAPPSLVSYQTPQSQPQPGRYQMPQYQSPSDFRSHVSREGQNPAPSSGSWNELLTKIQPNSGSPQFGSVPGHNQNPYAPPMSYTPPPPAQYTHPASSYPAYPGYPPNAGYTSAPVPNTARKTSGSPAPGAYNLPHPAATMRAGSPHSLPAPAAMMRAGSPHSLPAPVAMMRTSSGGALARSASTDSNGRPMYDPTRSPVRPNYSPISEHSTPRPAGAQGDKAKVVGLGLENFKI